MFLKGKEKLDAKILYKEVFDDSEAFVNYFYNTRIKDIEIIGIRNQEEEIVCMLHLIPRKVMRNEKIEEVYYIYAVATKEEHRRKGHMQQIFSEAFEFMCLKGKKWTYLITDMPIYYSKFNIIDTYPICKNIEYSVAKLCMGVTTAIALKKDFAELAKVCNELKNFDRNDNIARIYYDEEYFTQLNESASCDGGWIEVVKHKGVIIGYRLIANQEKSYIVQEVLHQRFKAYKLEKGEMQTLTIGLEDNVNISAHISDEI